MNAASFVAWMAALTTMAAANARMEWDEFQEDVPVEKDFLTEAELKIVNDFRKLMMEKALSTPIDMEQIIKQIITKPKGE